ncbi:MAG TPA: UDP-N-acetylmuramate dehydrogenase [Bacilli bacterium]|nr:UDP-N-acetylmuramate dehydrogenase [Bacilli bacterium]
MKELIKEISKNKIGKIEKNIPLRKKTTYKVGGTAKLIIVPKNINKLILLLKILKKKNIDYKILGNGSNLIFSDKVYSNVLIKLDELKHYEINDTIVKAEAGCSLISIANKTAKMGLTGMEFATGIPGTIGGAVYMNAGAYKSDMGYIVSEVKVLNPNMEIITMYNKDLNYKYRSSFFQKNKDYIILEATIVLKKGNKEIIKEIIEDRKKKRLMTQPLEFSCAGSVFRNPENDYAGRLVEICGLKGYTIGGAEVSKKHANFIINTGHATAKDVHDLILYVRDTVKKEIGIDLMIEQEFVNWE